MKFYYEMPKLEQTALIRTAISLWTPYIAKYYDTDAKDRLEVENEVLENVPKLSLPESLREKVLGLIRPIGLEILVWAVHHKSLLSDSIVRENLVKLCWTSRGTVDKKTTAEALVRDENLDITKRYEFACLHCLEDDVKEIWKSMPQREKAALFDKVCSNITEQHKLVVFWTYYIEGKIALLNDFISKTARKEMSPDEFALECAADDGNQGAFEYVLLKLNPKKQNESVIKYFEYIAKKMCDICFVKFDYMMTHIDLFFFLLSQMDEEQQRKVLKQHLYVVLYCLLEWPWQRFFMETAKRAMPFINEGSFAYLVERITQKSVNDYKDWNYQKLFGDFWRQTPSSLKILLSCTEYGCLIPKLLELKDKENLKLILKSSPIRDRKSLLFSGEGRSNCENLIQKNEKDMLKFYVQVCTNLPLKNILLNFKRAYNDYMLWDGPSMFDFDDSEEGQRTERREWRKFFQLLDDFIEDDEETINSGRKRKPKFCREIRQCRWRKKYIPEEDKWTYEKVRIY